MAKLTNSMNLFYHSVLVYLIPLDKADHPLDNLSENSVISLEAVKIDDNETPQFYWFRRDT